MMTDLKSALSRPGATFLQDIVGLVALVVMLFVGLHVPLIA